MKQKSEVKTEIRRGKWKKNANQMRTMTAHFSLSKVSILKKSTKSILNNVNITLTVRNSYVASGPTLIPKRNSLEILVSVRFVDIILKKTAGTGRQNVGSLTPMKTAIAANAISGGTCRTNVL